MASWKAALPVAIMLDAWRASLKMALAIGATRVACSWAQLSQRQAIGASIHF
jgi:hypothetical protein